MLLYSVVLHAQSNCSNEIRPSDLNRGLRKLHQYRLSAHGGYYLRVKSTSRLEFKIEL
jgi:hypothetical protein